MWSALWTVRLTIKKVIIVAKCWKPKFEKVEMKSTAKFTDQDHFDGVWSSSCTRFQKIGWKSKFLESWRQYYVQLYGPRSLGRSVVQLFNKNLENRLKVHILGNLKARLWKNSRTKITLTIHGPSHKQKSREQVESPSFGKFKGKTTEKFMICGIFYSPWDSLLWWI